MKNRNIFCLLIFLFVYIGKNKFKISCETSSLEQKNIIGDSWLYINYNGSSPLKEGTCVPGYYKEDCRLCYCDENRLLFCSNVSCDTNLKHNSNATRSRHSAKHEKCKGGKRNCTKKHRSPETRISKL